MRAIAVTKELLEEIALKEEEYNLIIHRLGREPNLVELGMFGALWSEHCGYKHSKDLLRRLPSAGRQVLVRPGEENAGAVAIGQGLAVVFKMESHNHPSAIEPFQGAATGVGGIVRDIFAMGARPMALMNSLRFGPLSERRNRYLFSGVVAGISSYGNCLGIPDVGGEVCFSPAYSHNPLVNAFCLGVVPQARLVKAQAAGEGNSLILVGADTGRDGLHGASGLASRTFEEERELRAAVQVGNPFLEKLLIEACLELGDHDWTVGVTDLGAAGLTSAIVEAAGRGGSGVEVDVRQVPRREDGMTAYEVMLAESQERMLVIVKRGFEEQVRGLFHKWDLTAEVIGRVTGDGIVRVREGEAVVAQVPVGLLTHAPRYSLAVRKPARLHREQSYPLDSLPDVDPRDCNEVLLRLLASPNIASKAWVYRQYDHQVGDNTIIPPGADAALLRVKGTGQALALTCDGNGRYCYLDPYRGGVMAVAEAARNLACVGAQPLALTDCLNLGNPERPEIYYQLKECIRGLAHACRRLGIPVISGNVSLYNETRGQAIYPTPVVGMVGLLEDERRFCSPGFHQAGDMVYLLGGFPRHTHGLAGSEYLELSHGLVAGRPAIDLELEIGVQQTCRQAIKRGILSSAHDCSEGGLAVAIAESAILGGLGFQGVEWPVEGRRDASFFGEFSSRIVVSLPRERVPELEAIAMSYGVPLVVLGRVAGQHFRVPGYLELSLAWITQVWTGGLEGTLTGK